MKRIARGMLIGVAALLAGYVTWDRVEVHQLNRDIAEIAARGEPTSLSAIETAPQTPQQQEAAQLYAEAASRAREMTQQDGRLTRIDVDGVVGRVDIGEFESSFRKDAPALQLLDRATPLPFAGFGDIVEGPDWVNVAGLQSLSALGALRADLLAYHGDGEAAAASLAAAVRVQRTLVELFYQTSLAVRQFGSLRVLLRHSAPSAASLEALQRVFAEMPDDDLLRRDLIQRRARLIELGWDAMEPGGTPAIVGVAFHPFLVRMVRVQIEQFADVLAIAGQPWPDKIGPWTALASTNTTVRAASPFRRMLVGPPLNVAALSSSPIVAATRLVVRRLAVTALAIERYRRVHGGDLPPDLASLVPALLPAVPIDPFSGAPFIYKPSHDGYLLYGVDSNRIDDGGKIYGLGSLNPMPLPRLRDFGISVPLIPRPGAQ